MSGLLAFMDRLIQGRIPDQELVGIAAATMIHIGMDRVIREPDLIGLRASMPLAANENSRVRGVS